MQGFASVFIAYKIGLKEKSWYENIMIKSPNLILFIWLVGTSLLSAIIVKLMTRIAILDQPVQRSSHTIPTPKGGGIGIIGAFAIGLLIIFPLFHITSTITIKGILLAVIMLSVLSWFDDIRQWPASIKLIGQIIAAAIVTISVPLLPLLNQTNFFLIILIMIWLVYVTNAFNFMDGLNGLASGVAAICCIFVYFYTNNIELKLTALALLCGLMGFLPFNYPYAQIFMGDVGSQACGLLLGSFALFNPTSFTFFSFKTHHNEALLVFFLLFGLLYDVSFTLIRRIIVKAPIMQAHRSHLYQIAHRCGIKTAFVTLIEWFFCIWGGALIFLLPPTHNKTMILSIGLLLLPQLIWTIFVFNLAKRNNLKKWE